jgi:hypothetical protein
MSKDAIDIESLKCHFIKNDFHFLNQPKVLPCNNTACLTCIASKYNENTK